MATIKPFKAFRPIPELAEKIASLPYDVINSDEARALAKDNPYSFLHVIKAEIDCDPSVERDETQIYEKARENLSQMMRDGMFIQDADECLYIYREAMHDKLQIGLVACTAIGEYLQGSIKIHELTRADKEQERIEYINACDANTGLIFLTYRQNEAINTLMAVWMHDHGPVYDFTSEDGIHHTVWVIDDHPVIDALVNQFAQIDSLYIADGHHRSASAVKVGEMRRSRNPGYTGDEPFNYFLSVLFPSNQVYIMDYNRVVRDLHGLSPQEFLQKVQETFLVEISHAEGPYRPVARHTFGMYFQGKWYALTAKPGSYDHSEPTAGLDVSILQENLLSPILGIEDPRTDKRIDFIGGVRGLRELEKRVAEGMSVAFSMFPTSIDEVMAVADAGKTMPPKSTWFEPKLRSGLFMHKLS